MIDPHTLGKLLIIILCVAVGAMLLMDHIDGDNPPYD